VLLNRVPKRAAGHGRRCWIDARSTCGDTINRAATVDAMPGGGHQSRGTFGCANKQAAQKNGRPSEATPTQSYTAYGCYS